MSSSEEDNQLNAEDSNLSDEENFLNNEENEYNIYFVPNEFDEEEFDDDDEDDEGETESEENDDADEIDQDYEGLEFPEIITYNTELSSNHEYLGQNFEEVSASKSIHDDNDVIQIPILDQASDTFFENDYENSVQLIPGQVMPIYFYSPIQIQVIRKRLNEKNPTIGFSYNPKLLRLNRNQEPINFSTLPEESKLGIVAEIISASYHNENNELADFSSLIDSAGGLILKVKGKDRFEILNIQKDITGIGIGTVKILPEYVLSTNPLSRHAVKNINFIYETYLHKSDLELKQVAQKAEYYNTNLNQPAWVYRNFDCDYLIYFIKKELNETFKIKFEDSNLKLKSDSGLTDSNNSKVFCSWLLTNFPFDNKMRISILRMNCINQRLMFINKLLKKFTNINCRLCDEQFCTKSNVFSMSNNGFMGAYLNPGGVVHETLTVYKLKNFHIISPRPSTQHSWFPGYAWQIITCKRCNNHIGWKFTNALPDLKPERFFGLTRKAIRYAYQEEDDSNDTEEFNSENNFSASRA